MVAASRLLQFFDFSVNPAYSDGTDAELREYAEITHMTLAPRRVLAERVRALGWVIHVDGALDITIEHPDGTPVPDATVTRLPSPDLYEHLKLTWKDFPPARNARFEIDAPGDAYLVLWLRGRKIERIALGEAFLMTHDPNVRMAAHNVIARAFSSPPISRVDAFRLRALGGIGRTYQLTFPAFFVLAALLYLTNLRWLARRGGWMTAALIAGLLSAIAARLLILALINVTSFLVLVAGYQSPSHALLLVAGVMMAHDGVVATRERWRKAA
jgi:hypothetical protein